MDEFFESLALREYAFGLIDPAIVEFVPPELTTQALVPKRLQASKHLMPILLDLRHLSGGDEKCLLLWLRDAARYLHRPPVAFFVNTCSDPDAFSRHWNVMQLAQPAPTRKFWLRMHDPRVMHQLLRILDPAQRRRLFGRSQSFHYWLSGRWFTVSRDLKDEVSRRSLSTGFSGWDWRRIERIGIMNRAMLRAGINDALALATKANLVEELIERALVCHGLTNHADLVEFAVKGLVANPNFDTHPAVARAIEMTVKTPEGASLIDYFSLIEEHVWDELGHFSS